MVEGNPRAGWLLLLLFTLLLGVKGTVTKSGVLLMFENSPKNFKRDEGLPSHFVSAIARSTQLKASSHDGSSVNVRSTERSDLSSISLNQIKGSGIDGLIEVENFEFQWD